MDSKELIEQVKIKTNCSHQEAIFLLDKFKWNTEQAIAEYHKNPSMIEEAQQSSSSARKAKQFSSLGDLQKEEKGKKQTYYTGGDQSGMMVQDKLDDDGEMDIIEQLMKKARAEMQGKAPMEDESDEREKVTRTLTFYRDGFTIEDSKLYSYAENSDILEQLKSGRAPLDLLNVTKGQLVELGIKNVDENYQPPVKKAKPFDGAGMKLGCDKGATLKLKQSNPFTLDKSIATTNLRIILADGSRHSATFNHDNTLANIIYHIDKYFLL